jgi:putative membrane protein
MSDDARRTGSRSPADHAPAYDRPFTVLEDDAARHEPAMRRPEAEREPPVRMVIETDDETPINPSLEAPAGTPSVPGPSARHIGPGGYAVLSIAALVLVCMSIAVGEWEYGQLEQHQVAGFVTLPLMLAAIGFTGAWLWGEISSWRRLIVVDRLREDLSDTHLTAADRARFLAALQHLARTMDGTQRAAVRRFLSAAGDTRGADELRIMFGESVLRPMDDAALSAVQRAVYDTFFLALVSPTVVTDTAAFAIRAMAMIRAVATAYGHRPGKLGLYRLLKRVLADVALLSGVMIVMGRAAGSVGGLIRDVSTLAGAAADAHLPGAGGTVRGAGRLVAGATEAVGVEIADATAAASRAAQLGLLAIAVSRPITLSLERRNALSAQLRSMIFSLRRARQGDGTAASPVPE